MLGMQELEQERPPKLPPLLMSNAVNIPLVPPPQLTVQHLLKPQPDFVKKHPGRPVLAINTGLPSKIILMLQQVAEERFKQLAIAHMIAHAFLRKGTNAPLPTPMALPLERMSALIINPLSLLSAVQLVTVIPLLIIVLIISLLMTVTTGLPMFAVPVAILTAPAVMPFVSLAEEHLMQHRAVPSAKKQLLLMDMLTPPLPQPQHIPIPILSTKLRLLMVMVLKIPHRLLIPVNGMPPLLMLIPTAGVPPLMNKSFAKPTLLIPKSTMLVASKKKSLY